MAKYFDDLFDGLKRASEHLVKAADHQRDAMQELVTVANAGVHTEGEHEDLRESVARLEKLVMELVRRLPPTDARGSSL